MVCCKGKKNPQVSARLPPEGVAVESRNGKPLSALSDTVDYSRVLHNGVPRDVLESLLGEHDLAKQQEITALRKQVGDLSAALEHMRTAFGGADGASDIRTEVVQLRQEFATAIASLRGLMAEGDGDLHEMQLTSLRRQVSQLEGVLESNYQRELRVAEDRETALRSEMAQMRQDLRVALETLYRMPAEAEGSTGGDELKNLEKQVVELGASLVRSSDEQERAAIERENTLKAELAHMRRDLLVTLEASYQLPADRVEGLDAQIASWRGQVEELQVVILNMQEAQDEGAVRQCIVLENEMRQLGQQIQTTLESSLPPSDHEELLAQRASVTQLAERLDEQVSGASLHFEQLSEIVSGKSSALEAEFASLRADLQSAIGSLASRIDTAPESSGLAVIESLHQHVTELQSALTSRDDREVALLDERQRAFAAALDEELASLRADVRSAVESLSGQQAEFFGEHEREILLSLEQQFQQSVIEMEGREQRALQMLDERELALKEDLATLHRDVSAVTEAVSSAGTGTVDHSTDLETLRDTLAAVADEVKQVREEQRALLSAHGQSVHEELAASQDVLVEASIAIRDAASAGPPLTAEAVSEVISIRLGELQTHWNEAQTEQYRQLISQVAEIQSDLDNVSTGMQAIQPADSDGYVLDSSLLEQIRAFLEAVQTREGEGENSASVDELNRLRYEIQGLRSDLQTTLQSESTGAREGATGTPDFTLDDLVRVIATQSNAGKAEGDRLAANRDNVLRHELSQIRQEVQSAVQQARASASNGGIAGPTVDFSELHADFEEIRAGLARIPDSHDIELRGELTLLREDLHSAVDSLRNAALTQLSENSDSDNPLAERVAEHELALRKSQEDQRQWLEERDVAWYSQLGDLRSSLTSVVSEARQAGDEVGDDAWHEELIELRSEIAALAKLSETRETRDDSPVVDIVVALKTEMLQALESVRASNSVEVATPLDSPAIWDGLTALASSLQQASANQERIVESHQQTLQAALAQMREEMRSALSGLTRESMDTFETRQSQLRVDQLEMERNLAKLRQELVATKGDPGNKKKLWR
jgi:hypothetical protein